MTKKRTAPKAVAQRLNLNRYVDFEEEAANFDLPVKRVAQIAREVEEAGGPVFEISVTKSESELRERLEGIYSVEVGKLQGCPVNCCQEKFVDIHQFIAHQRIHLVCDSPDERVKASILRDIERTLVPTIEKTLGLAGALPPEERARIMEALAAKGLLSAGELDSTTDEYERER